ncbi:MAG: Nif3-like dinuclear metal center hexameric protein [Bifidobacteriaceae bacterium]|jgi:dinuclear metal center YbgI/SA1388 family protein|nr:Nif3-like dinuclear metal center hexameric protein [Bifidobacteriaceae bacterium]
MVNLSQVVSVLETLYPLRYAEEWDEPGLIVGDPFAPVSKIYCAVDPTEGIVDEALAWGADLLVTHHPLFFRSVHTVAGSGFRGAIVNKLIGGHCGLWVGHTNADAAYRGVSEALADALGLIDQVPLVPISDPAASHSVGLGRVGNLATSVSLQDFARAVVKVLPPTQRGVDVAGDMTMPVRRVAVLGGSGDSLFDEVRASGADAYVTSDLRHHPVLDARQQAVREAQLRGEDPAMAARPAFINTPHYASEKVWFRYALEDIPDAIIARFGGTEGEGREKARVEMKLSATNTDPFSAHFGPSAE